MTSFVTTLHIAMPQMIVPQIIEFAEGLTFDQRHGETDRLTQRTGERTGNTLTLALMFILKPVNREIWTKPLSAL
jgi:hypothetical protein